MFTVVIVEGQPARCGLNGERFYSAALRFRWLFAFCM